MTFTFKSALHKTMCGITAGICLLVGPATAAAQDSRLFAPEVTVQKQDYAEVRRRFRTKLQRQGPSPQDEPFHKAPSGVAEVEFPSGELRLKAWISPEALKSGTKLPAVLFLHGGFAFGPPDWEMSQPYRDAGFLVMTPMLRGENGQAGSFSMFYDEVADVLAAAEFLRKQPAVDAGHIYVAGHSAGGTLALLAAQSSRLFRAAASFDGSPDQQLLYNGSAAKPGVRKEVVFDPKDLRELQVRSPLAYAGSFKCPTRLYYSDEASIYFHHPSRRLVEVAKRKGSDVEAIRVKGNHSSHVAPAMKLSIAFFQQRLRVQSARLLAQRAVPEPQPSLKGNTTFKLKGFEDADTVTLAGTFNGWNPKQLFFGRENGQWVCRIDLKAGKHLYKFVVDGEWILDPENPLKEDDGSGNTNSVLIKER